MVCRTNSVSHSPWYWDTVVIGTVSCEAACEITVEATYVDGERRTTVHEGEISSEDE